MGISSPVRLAAMMPPILAQVSTSPLGRAFLISSSMVAGASSTTASAMATRSVGVLAPTSTMVTLPWLSRCVKLSFIDTSKNSRSVGCRDVVSNMRSACLAGKTQRSGATIDAIPKSNGSHCACDCFARRSFPDGEYSGWALSRVGIGPDKQRLSASPQAIATEWDL